MKKILITGVNGFIGSELKKGLLDYELFAPSKEELNLLSLSNVASYLYDKKFDATIHCAIKGGMRSEKDGIDCYYRNVQMVKNLIMFRDKLGLVVNIGSGAELNKNRNLDNVDEYNIDDDFSNGDIYGKSKHEIFDMIKDVEGFITLRLFGCFGSSEDDSRFIKTVLQKYMNKEDINIHQDIKFDYIYIKDFIKIVHYVLNYGCYIDTPITLNCCYNKKYMLSDIAHIINKFDDHRVNVIFDKKDIGNSYTGNSERLYSIVSLTNSFTGLEDGIYDMYCDMKTKGDNK